MEIIVKNWEHYNRALGKHITSKAQYNEEMKNGGFISYDEAKTRERQPAPFSVSRETISIMKSIKDSADKKGNVKLSDRQIDAMKKNGMQFGEKARLNLGTTGGFR